MKKSILILIAVICLIGFAPKTHATNCPNIISGTVTISSSCVFPGTIDGVDGGSITIATGATLTVTSTQTIVASSFVIQGTGSIVILGAGQLLTAPSSYLWMVDADRDGWPGSLAVVATSSSPGSNYVRLNTMLSRTVLDCNDSYFSLTNSCGGAAPGAPTIGTATAGNGSASVAFTAGSSGSSTITGYTATSNPGGFTGGGVGSPVTVSGLANGTSYTFTVTATNIYGTGPASAASNAVTPAGVATVPGAPNIGTATAGNTTATVSFTAPGSDGGSTITGYTVTSAPAGGTDSNAGTTNLTHTMTGLTNNTSYTFTVYATNAVGNSSSSAASNAVTPTTATTVPGAPTGLSAAVNTSQVSLSWAAPSSNGDSSITSYKIYRSTSSGTETYLASSASLSYTDTGSTSGYTYYYRVSAVNVIGEGGLSNEAIANCQIGYVDSDGDHYGTGSGNQVCSSGTSLPAGYASVNGDCDDTNASIYPGTTRTRYAALSVACGTASGSESQTCQSNGTWSGSYTLTSPPSVSTTGGYNTGSVSCGTYCNSGTASCQSNGAWSLPTSCTASSRTAYQALTSACGTYSYNSQGQTCQSRGYFDGSYTLTSPPAVSTTGGYTVGSSGCGTYSCSAGTASCQSNGTWSLPTSCTVSTATGYTTYSGACGTGCSSPTTAYCQSNGTWNPPLSCTASTRTMYAAATQCSIVTTCSAQSQTQTCQTSGSWSPNTDTYSSCTNQTALTGYVDSDGDGYGVGSSIQVCPTALGQLPTGYASNNTDCYDLNANAHPRSDCPAACGFMNVRGSNSDSAGHTGNSFDYNCDSVQTQYLSGAFVNSSCTNVADSYCAGLGCATGHCQYIGNGVIGWDGNSWFGWQGTIPACGANNGVYYYPYQDPNITPKSNTALSYYGCDICNYNNPTQQMACY
jgi:hypothetical protein